MKRNTVLMAIGLSLAATALAKPRQSEIRGLNANGPAHEYADKMMLFGQFVGDWEFDLVSIRPDGTRLKGSGEWHFGWALQGRAIQDVWIARDDVSKGMPRSVNGVRPCASTMQTRMRGTSYGQVRCEEIS